MEWFDDRKSLLCSTFICTIGYVLFFLLETPYYGVNDDIIISSLLKGSFGMESGVDGIFMSAPLSLMLNFLYGLVGSVDWYALLLYSCVLIGYILTVYTVFKRFADRFDVFIAWLVVTLFVYIILSHITFTAVALFLLCSGLMVLPCFAHGRRILLLVPAAITGMSYLLRPDLLPIYVVFAAPGILYLLIKKYYVAVLSLLVAVLCFFLVNNGMLYLYPDRYEGDRFSTFNKARAVFTDTNASTYRGNMTVAAMEKVGWSFDDYQMAKKWWFYDGDLFDAEKLRAFCEANGGMKLNGGSFKTLLRDEYFFIAGFFATYLMVAAFSSVKRERTWLVFGLAFVSLVSVVLISALRLQDRVYFPSLLISIGTAMLLTAATIDKRKQLYVKITQVTLSVAMVFVFCKTVVLYRKYDNHAAEVRSYTAKSMETVAKITGLSSIYVDFTPQIMQYVNLPFNKTIGDDSRSFIPGGWLIGSRYYHDFLDTHNLVDNQSMPKTLINNNDIIFRFWDQGGSFGAFLPTLLGHMRKNYGSSFSGQTIAAEVICDMRPESPFDNNGLVFFRLIAR